MIQQKITLSEIKAGESAILEFTFRSESTGEVVDMSDYTMTLAVRDNLDQDDDDITKENASWDKTDAADGIMRVTLSASDTAALTSEVYHLEVKAVYDGSTIKSKKDIMLPVLATIT